MSDSTTGVDLAAQAELARLRLELAKAQADTRALASAVSMYSAHMGVLPTALADVAGPAVNSEGQTAGPFMNTIPNPPSGWGAYTYTNPGDGTFSITTDGGSEGKASAP